MTEIDKLTSQLNKMGESLQALCMAYTKLHPFQKAAIDAARREEEKMIAFNDDMTGGTSDNSFYTPDNWVWVGYPMAKDLSQHNRPSNAQEVIAWRKRKKTHAFKCFFKTRVPIKRNKLKRPYKKKVRNHETVKK